MPDHSTFSKNRHGRFRDSDLLREVFETIVRRCIAERLVGGSDFASDASLIRAMRRRCIPCHPLNGMTGRPSKRPRPVQSANIWRRLMMPPLAQQPQVRQQIEISGWMRLGQS